MDAFSPEVITVLETLIAPGKQVRISPFVEEMQFQLLFGEVPDPNARYESARAILDRNHQKIDTLASIWCDFDKNGKKFQADCYGKDFLDTYLAYYLTVNVGKLQLMFLDLLRQCLIPKHFKLLDIGVASGTTFVAFLDFLVAWESACLLFNVSFPVESFSFFGVDASKDCLEYSQKAIITLINRLTAAKVTDLPLIDIANSAIWLHRNIAIDTLETPNQPTLLVCSNVLSEASMGDAGQKNVANLIRCLPEQSVVLLLEPGDKKRTTELNCWRHKLLAEDQMLHLVEPCGMEFGCSVPSQCGKCWNGRRESLHRPLLYQRFCKAASKISQREYSHWQEEHDNNLLSWSYLCFARIGRPPHHNGILTDHIVARNIGRLKKDHIVTRYIGRFRKWTDGNYQPQSDNENPVADEKIKFCPSVLNGNFQALTLERPKGYILPKLVFGQKVELVEVSQQPSDFSFEYRCQADIKPLILTKHSHGFLSEYNEKTRRGVDAIAHRLFGFPNMRNFQHQILARVLTGRSIFGIAATGGGKSECYILPALLLPGLTVVISPLISLMQDQYEQRLRDRYGLDTLATFINSSISFQERQTRIHRMELGYYKLIYLTPEQFEQGAMLDSLRRTHERVGFRYLALDEAHCISHWGHDFRPSYLNLLSRISQFQPEPKRIALTATASPKVRQDICEELGLDQRPLEQGGDLLVYSANRPELNLIVKVVDTVAEKVADIEERLHQLLKDNQSNKNPGAAIVFMPWTGQAEAKFLDYNGNEHDYSSRRTVSQFASHLERNLNIRVGTYHSKMNNDSEEDNDEPESDEVSTQVATLPLGNITSRSRRSEQQKFIGGKTTIMVATKGFGMGIDKPNIRLVLHHTTPDNLEAYTQEAGRAGRDGQLADVILYFTPQRTGEDKKEQNDNEVQRFFLDNKYIREEDVRIMFDFLCGLCQESDDLHPPGTRYFTGDEIIDFIEANNFIWPEFAPRTIKKNESREHKEILDRGTLYQHKINYIDRIFAALYRIRITYNQTRIGLLESNSKQGSLIKGGEIFDPQAIIDSNAYFGEFLRNRGIHKEHLIYYLSGDQDLIPFSKVLGLSMRETNRLITDIKEADGYSYWDKKDLKKKWKSNLLNFNIIAAPKRGLAKGRGTLHSWREYAGAKKYKINKGIIEKSNLDRWFDWGGLPYTTGWEITPGEVLKHPELFDIYLSEFMVIHDRRRDDANQSYQLLLRDYIGVDDTGRRLVQNKNCLRVVLLGYLKTNETVQGGRCGGCSVCCPDGRFELDLDKRKDRVIRLSEALVLLLTQIEQLDTNPPEDKTLKSFWQQVTEDEQIGYSVIGYLRGWTNRLLSETPSHVAANWIRAEGVIKEKFPLVESDLLKELEHLNIEGAQWLPRVAILLDQSHALIHKEMASYQLVSARIMANLGRPEQEIVARENYLKITQNKQVKDGRLECLRRLAALFHSTGLLPNPGRHEISLAQAIKLVPEESASTVDAYIGDWPFSKLLAMLSKVDLVSHEQLLGLWFQRQKGGSLTLLEDALTGLTANIEQPRHQDLNNKIFPHLLDQFEKMLPEGVSDARVISVIDTLGKIANLQQVRYLYRSANLFGLTKQYDSEIMYWNRLLALAEGELPEYRNQVMTCEAYRRLAEIFSPSGVQPNTQRHQRALLAEMHLEPKEVVRIVSLYVEKWSFDKLMEFLVCSNEIIYSSLIETWFSYHKTCNAQSFLNDAILTLEKHKTLQQYLIIKILLSPYLMSHMERLSFDCSDADKAIQLVAKLESIITGQYARFLDCAANIMRAINRFEDERDLLEVLLNVDEGQSPNKRDIAMKLCAFLRLSALFEPNGLFSDETKYQVVVEGAFKLDPQKSLIMLGAIIHKRPFGSLLDYLKKLNEVDSLSLIKMWFDNKKQHDPLALLETVGGYLLQKPGDNMSLEIKSGIFFHLFDTLQKTRFNIKQKTSIDLDTPRLILTNLLSTFRSTLNDMKHFEIIELIMWKLIVNIHQLKCNVIGVISGKNKGGFDVDLAGIHAFMPKSQAANIVESDVNAKLDFKIIELEPMRSNVVVSRSALLKDRLQVGQIIVAKIKRVVDYGAFIDCGYFEGLLHISNMGKLHVKNPSDFLSVGQEIKVEVLNIDHESNRYSLGLKQ